MEIRQLSKIGLRFKSFRLSATHTLLLRTVLALSETCASVGHNPPPLRQVIQEFVRCQFGGLSQIVFYVPDLAAHIRPNNQPSRFEIP
jgi:hypothetical protein